MHVHEYNSLFMQINNLISKEEFPLLLEQIWLPLMSCKKKKIYKNPSIYEQEGAAEIAPIIPELMW